MFMNGMGMGNEEGLGWGKDREFWLEVQWDG